MLNEEYHTERKENTVATLLNMKKAGEKVSMLTCYNYPTARIMENLQVSTPYL